MPVDKFVENIRKALHGRGTNFAQTSARNFPVIKIPIRFAGLARTYRRFRAKPLGQPRQFWRHADLCISQVALHIRGGFAPLLEVIAHPRMRRLCAWTAATNTSTLSGGVNCEIPWPRLNT